MDSRYAPRHGLPFDVVVLVTSAGGLDALTAVLQELPEDFPAAILVGQHLGAGSTLAEILARRTALPVAWVRDGERLGPGTVHVCPYHRYLQVRPDLRCTVATYDGEILHERPLDRLLQSVASSCGARALAVVLTGTGDDGARGARALHAAGGMVLVQDPATAEFGDMPQAAVAAGAADLVLQLPQIGPALAELASGPRPEPATEPAPL